MTATTHFIDSKTETQQDALLKSRDSLGILFLRFSGVALVFSAIGMWLAPGATYSTDLILMKLGVSVFFALTGLILFTSGKRLSDG